jgi:hypothetical protein
MGFSKICHISLLHTGWILIKCFRMFGSSGRIRTYNPSVNSLWSRPFRFCYGELSSATR